MQKIGGGQAIAMLLFISFIVLVNPIEGSKLRLGGWQPYPNQVGATKLLGKKSMIHKLGDYQLKFKITLILFLSLISTQLYAKKTWLNTLESGINIASNVVSTLNSLDQMAKRKDATKQRFVYENKVIYKEINTPDSEKIELKKRLSTTKRELAWEKAKDKKHIKAISLYEEALEYDANNPKIWHGYGWSLSELGRYKEAENAFMMSINLGGKQQCKNNLTKVMKNLPDTLFQCLPIHNLEIL